MSTATRLAWDDSMRFAVATLLRAAVYMTVVSTTSTTASTVSVIISSTRVKPRRANTALAGSFRTGPARTAYRLT